MSDELRYRLGWALLITLGAIVVLAYAATVWLAPRVAATIALVLVGVAALGVAEFGVLELVWYLQRERRARRVMDWSGR